MLTKTFGSALVGIHASIITIETHVGQGSKCYLVGLPDSTIKESIQRVESAIKQIGYFFPRRKVVINLAPADVRKEGSGYDLPIALGLLQASEQTKMRGLAKLLKFVLVVIPLGASTIHEKDLERLCGLLNWYAPGIPAGTAFIASLYQCKAFIGPSSRRVKLSSVALRDLMWWRALAIIAWKSPVVQSEIVRIRSTKAYDHIEELLTKGFIMREKSGRSYLIKLTPKFFEYFDISRTTSPKRRGTYPHISPMHY
jgi:hypothetical protein